MRPKAYLDKFKQRALVIRTIEEQQDTSASGAQLKKCLGAGDLIMLGIGGVVGAGVFVLTGVAARDHAGPAVVVSYALAALAALVAALCYAEFAVDLPVAGGAFNYVSLTFGEFAAWVVACDLILEYTLSAAAVAKGFTAYLAALIGMDIRHVRIAAHSSFIEFDIIALLAVLVISAVLAWGMTHSSGVNNAISGVNVLLVLFVIFAGFPNVHAGNYTPFWPSSGMYGVFSGAAVVFFSFIGFDTLSTVAEEVRNPAVNMPIGLLGSLGICTLLYMLMCVVITGMVQASKIDRDAPFADAFGQINWQWAKRLVAAGALTGITTSLLVALMGQARIYVTLGRNKLLPPYLAAVHPHTQTPIRATILTAITAGVLALFFKIDLLSNLVNIGTLAVFFMVCAGVLTRRYYVRGSGQSAKPIMWRVAMVAVCSISFSVTFTNKVLPAAMVFLVLWLAVTMSFYLLPVAYVPTKFKVPFLPFVPCFGMLATLHLIGSLGWVAYVRWIVWFLMGSCVYIFYGMHQQDSAPSPYDMVKLTPEGSSGSALSLSSTLETTTSATGLQQMTIVSDRSNLLNQSHVPSVPPLVVRKYGDSHA